MPNLASVRHESGPDSPCASGSIAAAGSRTPSSASSAVTEARSDILCLISVAVKPGVSGGTTKPRTPSAVRAQTTATSATEPLVIHILLPVRTQSPRPSGAGSWTARVRIPPGSEPKSGSVSPKQPIASPVAIRGSHASFCSADPCFQIAYIARDPCTETIERRPESPASSSGHVRPLVPARDLGSKPVVDEGADRVAHGAVLLADERVGVEQGEGRQRSGH